MYIFHYTFLINKMNEAFFQVLYQDETLYQVEARPKTAPVVAATPVITAEAAPTVAVAAPTQRPAPPPAVALPQLNHQVLILVKEEPAQFEADKAYLGKILGAINLSWDGVDIVNVYGSEQLDFRAALNVRKVHHFISFGVPFLEVNLDILMNIYDPKRIKGVNFLFADRLSIIEADVERKRKLWTILKSLFLGK